MTRRTQPLPPQLAAPILDVVHRARAAATSTGTPTQRAAAEAGQTRIPTGYKAARRTASAGQYAAHALRLAALEAARPTAPALQAAAAAFNTWQVDPRTAGADALRHVADSAPPAAARELHTVAAWLDHTVGHELVATTAALCRLALDTAPDHLGPAWHATHGQRLRALLEEAA